MKTVSLQSQSRSDGKLHLEIPVDIPNAAYDLVVVMQPGSGAPEPQAPGEDGWPRGFFEATAGAWQGTFVRDQGQFEEREEL